LCRPAAILDRDGVINDNRRIVNEPADFILYDSAGEGIRLLNQAGFLVLVATNQGGVGLGYMSELNLQQIHEEMSSRLAAVGARIDDVLACTHAPHADCPCRKPRPGMILQFLERYGLKPATTFMVGDRRTDIEAGRNAGVQTVLIGDKPSREANYTAVNLKQAAEWMIKQVSS